MRFPRYMALPMLLVLGYSNFASAQTLLFKPDTDLCLDRGFGGWLWLCDQPNDSSLAVDKVTSTKDSLLKSLSATNQVSFNTSCDLLPEASLSFSDGNRNATFSISKNGKSSTFSSSSTVGSINTKKYKVKVTLPRSIQVRNTCELKVLSNTSTVNVSPLKDVSKIVYDNANEKLDMKLELVKLKTLPSSWGSLDLEVENIEDKIVDLEFDLEDAVDDIERADIKLEIDDYKNLVSDLKAALKISETCGPALADPNQAPAKCLTAASKIIKRIDTQVSQAVAKLKVFEKFITDEIKRTQAKNQEYVEALKKIQSRLKRYLDKLNEK